ncbi:hypothetical protein DRX19_12590 [Salmonella enterica subsp. enterica]|nr:hypothetical protein [Salmonella enterica subsp. enterica serovar Pensacola]
MKGHATHVKASSEHQHADLVPDVLIPPINNNVAAKGNGEPGPNAVGQESADVFGTIVEIPRAQNTKSKPRAENAMALEDVASGS